MTLESPPESSDLQPALFPLVSSPVPDAIERLGHLLAPSECGPYHPLVVDTVALHAARKAVPVLESMAYGQASIVNGRPTQKAIQARLTLARGLDLISREIAMAIDDAQDARSLRNPGSHREMASAVCINLLQSRAIRPRRHWPMDTRLLDIMADAMSALLHHAARLELVATRAWQAEGRPMERGPMERDAEDDLSMDGP